MDAGDLKSGPKTTEADKLLEKEEKLQSLIASKEYDVHIKESGSGSTRTFIITFFVVGLIAIAAILLMIDAEIIGSGIDLPFDLL